jgi:proteasome lid subunit RPN8/RPN11
MVDLAHGAYAQMVGQAYDGLPDEACGLLSGPAGGNAITGFHPCRNTAESSRIYTIDPTEHLRIDRAVEDAGLEIVGVMHSHTHTDAYPSPTDVAQAPDPGWHYIIVSLRQAEPVARSYRIIDGKIGEESVVLIGQ